MVLSIIFVGCDKDDDTTDPTGNTTGTFTDARDNTTYNWVKIGNQTWMAGNLGFKPSSGDFIAHENNDANIDIYGYLYDWTTAKNVAPAGWHLPSEDEWLELVNFLGGDEVAGGKMKETGTSHWDNPNSEANNSSGFMARAGGFYDSVYDNFIILGRSANWWSSTDGFGDNNEAAFTLVIYSNTSKSSQSGSNKLIYQSVRCIKD